MAYSMTCDSCGAVAAVEGHPFGGGLGLCPPGWHRVGVAGAEDTGGPWPMGHACGSLACVTEVAAQLAGQVAQQRAEVPA